MLKVIVRQGRRFVSTNSFATVLPLLSRYRAAVIGTTYTTAVIVKSIL